MKIRSEKGVTNLDYVIAILIFISGSVAALGLYLSIYTSMAKIKINETIVGYITEICETIDLEVYNTVDTKAEINTLIGRANIPPQYKVECIGIDKYNGATEGEENDVIEKINIKVNYEIDGNDREYIISKVKVKE